MIRRMNELGNRSLTLAALLVRFRLEQGECRALRIGEEGHAAHLFDGHWPGEDLGTEFLRFGGCDVAVIHLKVDASQCGGSLGWRIETGGMPPM